MQRRWLLNFAIPLLVAACATQQVHVEPLAQAPTQAIQLVQAVTPTQPIPPTATDAPTQNPTETSIPPVTATLTQLQQEAAAMGNFGQAPELHEAIWLNTEEPLKLANLRGKVVLLDMWTFD